MYAAYSYKTALKALVLTAVLAVPGCAGRVILCDGGTFDRSRYFTRAEASDAVEFVQYCIWFEHWRPFYDTLSELTKKNISYLEFWIGIESIPMPGQDEFLVNLLKHALVEGPYWKRPPVEGIKEVSLLYDSPKIGTLRATIWMKKEKGRWRMALWEMKEFIEKDIKKNP